MEIDLNLTATAAAPPATNRTAGQTARSEADETTSFAADYGRYLRARWSERRAEAMREQGEPVTPS